MNNNVVNLSQQIKHVRYRTFVGGNIVIGMRNVVMVFANMGMGTGNWEMGISTVNKSA